MLEKEAQSRPSTHATLGAGSKRGLLPPLLTGLPGGPPSRAARTRFPEERPKELLRRLASFLGVLARAESSSSPALYSSTFSSKSGPASVLGGNKEMGERSVFSRRYSLAQNRKGLPQAWRAGVGGNLQGSRKPPPPARCKPLDSLGEMHPLETSQSDSGPGSGQK